MIWNWILMLLHLEFKNGSFFFFFSSCCTISSPISVDSSREASERLHRWMIYAQITTGSESQTAEVITVGTLLIASFQIRSRHQTILTDWWQRTDRPWPLQNKLEIWVHNVFALPNILMPMTIFHEHLEANYFSFLSSAWNRPLPWISRSTLNVNKKCKGWCSFIIYIIKLR